MNDDREELAGLFTVLADSMFQLGHDLVRIGVVGPDLGASLGAVAVAQMQLGHARLLYRWRQELLPDHDVAEDAVLGMGENALPGLRDIQSWVELVTKLSCFEEAAALVVRRQLANGPAHQFKTAKLLQEMEDILTYGGGWVEQFAGDAPGVRARAEKARADLLPALTDLVAAYAEDVADFCPAAVLAS
jgi:ring-1,2-phenylacetyl-CoA epoxidase subunit PaaC